MNRQHGFTLIEIAVVLVIIGLILGGILKGRELIDGARVRAMSNDINGMRAAWYAFQERYNNLPGDFSRASVQIDNSLGNGDGNGKIDTVAEVAGVWQHLAAAGFIVGHYDGASAGAGSLANLGCRTSTCPVNPFNGFYKIVYGAHAPAVRGSAHELFSGGQIPAGILLQLDLKLDDGIANGGEIQSHADTDSDCRRDADWDLNGVGAGNCGAVIRGF